MRWHVASPCFTSGGRHQEILRKMLIVRQKICFQRERIAEVVRGRLALPPTDPGQTSTRMGAHPIAISILVVPGEVTVYQLTCHFISLHSVSLRWVTRKGDRP